LDVFYSMKKYSFQLIKYIVFCLLFGITYMLWKTGLGLANTVDPNFNYIQALIEGFLIGFVIGAIAFIVLILIKRLNKSA
jgi:hypothetical protein